MAISAKALKRTLYQHLSTTEDKDAVNQIRALKASWLSVKFCTAGEDTNGKSEGLPNNVIFFTVKAAGGS